MVTFRESVGTAHGISPDITSNNDIRHREPVITMYELIYNHVRRFSWDNPSYYVFCRML